MNSGKMADAVPHLSLTVEEHSVIEGALEILQIIRPNWQSSDIRCKFFTDGITNKLVGCFYEPSQNNIVDTPSTQSIISSDGSNGSNGSTGSLSDAKLDNNVVLVRVYGHKTDLLIDRGKEIENILLLHKYGLAPALYATFENGMAYAYEAGVTLTPDTCKDDDIWPLVACRMAQMHKKVPTGKVQFERPVLQGKVYQFLELVPERFTDPIINDRVWQTFPCPSDLRLEFDILYARLQDIPSPVVFCHNDLLLGNVIYDKDHEKVSFIDYEYAGVNHQAFDIGNHFAEFAGIDEIDYERYPSREFQLRWLTEYLLEYHGYDKYLPGKVEDEAEYLYVQVNQYALAAHFMWAVWALVQAEHSAIDFDYVRFAEARFLEYRRNMEIFFELQLPDWYPE
ncbi:choline/ethanolamine kinase [Anopheles darlingi]|uniref:ethanolamine kinase n=1 Tax=Anopheles darlingi TaxID=43151 RepID=W5JVX3_ANODA|nr:choline/ethanolamine kinase [Anopheles darlingi]